MRFNRFLRISLLALAAATATAAPGIVPGSAVAVAWAEYKPTATLSIRAQVNIWNDIEFERIVYADRTTRAVDFIESRTVDPRTFYSVRLRKTF